MDGINWAAIGMSCCTGLVGLAIGFYKASALAAKERAESEKQFVRKEDCIRCGEEKHEKFTDFDRRLTDGAAVFGRLETSIAVIREKVEAIERRLQNK